MAGAARTAKLVFFFMHVYHCSRVAMWFKGKYPIGFDSRAVQEVGPVVEWIPLIIFAAPVCVLAAALLGVMTVGSARFWTVNTSQLAQAICGVFIIRGLQVEGPALVLLSNMPFLAMIIFEALRCSLEVGGFMPSLPLVFRLVPPFLIGVASLARLVDQGSDLLVIGALADVMVLVAFMMLSVLKDNLVSAKAELQQQRDVFMSLLDVATDGFCSVEAGKGQLTELSASLQQTLRKPGAQSLEVSKVMASERDVEQFLAMTKSVRALGDGAILRSKGMPTCLVTCLAPSERPGHEEEFEVRLFPFRPPQGQLQVCFQVASERRHVEAAFVGDRMVSRSSVDSEEARCHVADLPWGGGHHAAFLAEPDMQGQPKLISELSWDKLSDNSLAYSASTAAPGHGAQGAQYSSSHRPRAAPSPRGPETFDQGVQTLVEGIDVCARCGRPPIPSKPTAPLLGNARGAAAGVLAPHQRRRATHDNRAGSPSAAAEARGRPSRPQFQRRRSRSVGLELESSSTIQHQATSGSNSPMHNSSPESSGSLRKRRPRASSADAPAMLNMNSASIAEWYPL